MPIINLPRRLDIRLPAGRRNHKSRPKAIVIQLKSPVTVSGRSDFDRASKLDETDPAAAIPMYEAIIARHDHNEAGALVNLGSCYFNIHDQFMAETCYMRALAVNPSEPCAAYNLGYLELERGNAAPALALLRRATELDPRFSDAWFNRGGAAEMRAGGRCPEARLCFGRYLRIANRDPVWDNIAKEKLAL